MNNCAYYTDGRHRWPRLKRLGNACACGAMKPADLFDQIDAPTREHDPHSSKTAAERARRSAPGQARAALAILALAGPGGATTREVQKALYSPADPAWNKVPTRLLSLYRKGLVERHDQTRPWGGRHFLVYEITAAGTTHLEDQ